MKQPKLFDEDNAWSLINEYIEAGGTIPEVQMRFRAACEKIRDSHRTTVANFRRALFRILQERCGLSSFEEVAQRFLFTADEIPVNEVEDAPEIAAEIRAANDEINAAESKRSLAYERARIAQARLERIDFLMGQLPILKQSIEYIEGLPDVWKQDIADAEAAIMRHVYSLPGYTGIGHPDAFIMEKQKVIVAAKAAIDAHPERLKKTHEILAGVRREIADLKKGSKKKEAA